MKIRYYFSLKSHGDSRYYIHSEDCPLLPSPEKRLYLGRFKSTEEAIMAARKYFINVSCCRFCQSETVKKINFLLQGELTVNSGFISSGMIKSTPDCILMCCIN